MTIQTTLHAPQVIYLALTLVGLGFVIARHGKLKTGRHDAWADAIATAIVLTLLWWGGFFSN